MQIVIQRNGDARCLYDEAINLTVLGSLEAVLGEIDRELPEERVLFSQLFPKLGMRARVSVGPCDVFGCQFDSQ